MLTHVSTSDPLEGLLIKERAELSKRQLLARLRNTRYLALVISLAATTRVSQTWDVYTTRHSCLDLHLLALRPSHKSAFLQARHDERLMHWAKKGKLPHSAATQSADLFLSFPNRTSPHTPPSRSHSFWSSDPPTPFSVHWCSHHPRPWKMSYQNKFTYFTEGHGFAMSAFTRSPELVMRCRPGANTL